MVVGDLNMTIENIKSRKNVAGFRELMELSWGIVGKTSVRRNGDNETEKIQIDHLFTKTSIKWNKLTEPGEMSDHSLIHGTMKFLRCK